MAKVKKISEEILLELQENMCGDNAIGKLKNPDEVLLNLYFLDALGIKVINERELKTNILSATELYLWKLRQLKEPIDYVSSTPLKKGLEITTLLMDFYQKSVIDLSEYPPEASFNDVMSKIETMSDVKILLVDEKNDFSKKGTLANINKLLKFLERDLKTLTEKETLSQINREFDDKVFDFILKYTKNKISKTQLLKDIQAFRISIKKNFVF